MKSIRFNCLLTAIVFISLTACNSGNEKKTDLPENAVNSEVVNNPATASSEAGNSTDKIPVFQFQEEVHDFGTITQGEIVSFAFRFKNSGKGDLIIASASGSCGCTVPDYPKDPVAPGKEGVINVTFNSEGKEGAQDKTVTIIANSIPNTKVLTIKGEVVKPK